MTPDLSLRHRVLAVLGGGFLGSITRYLLSMAIQSWLGKGWPYDILSINLTGAFLLALLTTLADAAIIVGPGRRLFINTGFLGAYTTFSSLALGDVLLLARAAWMLAVLYLILSIGGGLLAVLAGDRVGQLVLARVRRPSRPLDIPELPETPDGHLDIQDDLLRMD